jgi:hypothetical protein
MGVRTRGRVAGRRSRSSASRSRRQRVRISVVVGAAVAALALLIGIAAIAASRDAALVCLDAAGRPIDPEASIAGYGAEQLANAKTVMDVGAAQGAPLAAQEIAVMTAMGESGLRVLDRGDAAGPDSRGLFQQRDNGAWGSYEDRMDPSVSATNFYRSLLALPDWQSLEPTVAAHLVQRNSDERHYERYFAPAQEVVRELGVSVLSCGPAGDAG